MALFSHRLQMSTAWIREVQSSWGWGGSEGVRRSRRAPGGAIDDRRGSTIVATPLTTYPWRLEQSHTGRTTAASWRMEPSWYMWTAGVLNGYSPACHRLQGCAGMRYDCGAWSSSGYLIGY